MTDKSTLICPQCQIGHLQASHKTYLRVVSGMVMSVPDTIVNTCDVCGFHEFDRALIAQVDALVGENRKLTSPSRSTSQSMRIDGKSTQGLKG